MHFYELHEGDDDVFADLLLAREEEMEPEDFFDVVQSIRRRVGGWAAFADASIPLAALTGPSPLLMPPAARRRWRKGRLQSL